MYLFEDISGTAVSSSVGATEAIFARASLKTAFFRALSPVRIFKSLWETCTLADSFFKGAAFPEVRFKKMTLRKVDFCGADFPHLKGHGPLRLQNRKDHPLRYFSGA